MVYYECIEAMRLYKKHEIKDVEVITEYPIFATSAWLKITTTEGKHFYTTRINLDDMQKYENLYPTEERRRRYELAPAQKT